MDCQEFIKHPSQNKNASPAICEREPRADPSRTRVPHAVDVSWKLANPSLWVEKLVEFFLSLKPPCSLLSTLKHCCLHVQLCGRGRLWPQRSGSRRRVHHCGGSRPALGFSSPVIPVEMTRRGGLKVCFPGVAGLHPGAPVPGRLLGHPNKRAGNAYWGTEGAEPKRCLNEIFTKELKTQPGQRCSVPLSIFTFKLTFIGV